MSDPRSRILAYHQLIELANNITAGMIMTDNPLGVDINYTVLETRRLMDVYQFDQMVVYQETEAVGLINRQTLRNKSDTLAIGRLNYEPLSFQNSLPQDVNMSWVLDMLSQRDACLVRDVSNVVVGIIHISDLNRHPVRLYFYLLLSAAEMGMAGLIEKEDPNANWFERIPRKNRESIRRYYDRQLRQNIETTLLSTASFADLVEILSTMPQLEQVLIHTQDEMQILRSIQSTENNDNVRNRIMHLTKALVQDKKDVYLLNETGKFLQRFLRRIEQIG